MRVSGCWGPQKLDFINVAKQLDEPRHLQLKRIISHYFAHKNQPVFKFAFCHISHSVSSLYYFASKPNRHCVQDGLHKNYLFPFPLDSSRIKLIARDIHLLGVCEYKISFAAAYGSETGNFRIANICPKAEEQTYWALSLFHLAHKNLPCQLFVKNNLSSNNKQTSFISPAPSLFLSPLFSLIYL